ncbi:MAG: MFS transporter [Candidatus Gracilibacteria bacterium]|nr:MFS transporter [Candidatus Gracilibacteria bacterium]
MNENIKSNIWKLYTITALERFMLFIPTIVLFFQENGLNMREILLLQSVFSLGMILFEIPSGYFSDVLGRKYTLVFGSILGFFGICIYAFSYGFYGFMLAELVLGLGASFISGTDSALLYDTLEQIGKTDDYKKIEGKMSSVGNFSEAIASVLGGFLALISLRTPLYIEIFIMFLTIPISLSLIEPSRHKYKNEEGVFKEILKIVKYSVHHHKEVKWLIFYSGFVGASTLTMVWFIQPYFSLVGLPLAYFGFMWGLLNLSVGLFSLYAHKIEKYLGRKKSLISLIFLSFLGYILVAIFQSLWSIIFIFIFYFVRGFGGPVIMDYINKIISSNMRATVLSIKNLFARVVYSIIGPFIGWIADIYSFSQAFVISGTIFLTLGALSLLFLHKYKAL